jgi:hypothetical protein
MASLEWTRSVRAGRDAPVADYSAPSLITMCRVADRPPIAVSPDLLALTVSYFARTLWLSGKLWPYTGMGSLVTRLHQNCNMMGDVATISSCVSSTYAQNAIHCILIRHIIPSHQIYVGIDNPSLILSVCCLTTCSYLWNYVHAADGVSHADKVPSNSGGCVSHWFKFPDRI